MTRPPLQIVGMDAFDVEGVCFAQFSVEDWLSGQARRNLEAMIVASGCDDMSPSSIGTAFFHAKRIMLRNITASVLAERVASVLAERSKRLAARGIFRPKITPKPRTEPDIWAGTGLNAQKICTTSRTATAADLAF